MKVPGCFLTYPQWNCVSSANISSRLSVSLVDDVGKNNLVLVWMTFGRKVFTDSNNNQGIHFWS